MQMSIKCGCYEHVDFFFSPLPTLPGSISVSMQPCSHPHTKLASLSSIQLTAERPRGASLLSGAQEEGLQSENKSRRTGLQNKRLGRER